MEKNLVALDTIGTFSIPLSLAISCASGYGKQYDYDGDIQVIIDAGSVKDKPFNQLAFEAVKDYTDIEEHSKKFGFSQPYRTNKVLLQKALVVKKPTIKKSINKNTSKTKLSKIKVPFKDITKTFGTVVANDHINFDVYENEILALLGETGSAKTNASDKHFFHQGTARLAADLWNNFLALNEEIYNEN